MDRKVIALGVLALILAILMMSGCTSGPATNATVTPNASKATMGPTVKPMTNVSDMGAVGNNTTTTMPGSMANNTTTAPK